MALQNKPTAREVAHVVGGGFIGLASALALQADGFHVELYDASEDTTAASFGNAGHIATEQLAPLASWSNIKRLPSMLFSGGGPAGFPISQMGTWLPFGLRLLAACGSKRFQRGLASNTAMLAQALPAWQALLSRIQQSALLSTTGHQLVWESTQSAAAGMQAWLAADLGTASARALDTAEMRNIGLRFAGKPVGGIQFSGTGHIHDLQALRTAMREALVKHGGVWHKQAIKCVIHGDEGAQLLLENAAYPIGEAQDLIVLCAGVRSAQRLDPAFGSLPMIAERGYHLQLEQGSSSALTQPIVFEDRSLIATPFSHGLRLASFTEFSSTDAPPDARKWQRLKQHAHELGIAVKDQACTTWIGSRPTLPDYLPAIGRSSAAPNLIVACGHNHLGLTLAPITGELVRQLARRETPSIDMTALAPQRYLKHF